MRDESQGQTDMKYFSKHIGDFASATRHLSLAEKGAYNELIDYYYATEKPLPADLDALCRITGAFSEQERKAVQAVADAFFEKVDGALFHAKIEDQIVAYHEQAEKNRMNGQAGGRPRKHRPENPVGNPEGSQSETQTETEKKAIQYPVTSNHKEEPKTKTKAQKPASPTFALPDWLPVDAWHDFAAMRKGMRKGMTEAAQRIAVKKLDELRAKGQDPQAVLEQSTMRGWLGLFPVKDDFARAAIASAKASRHSGFDNIDYHEGVSADGTF
jgi:uncharacterized protein YdaU (DUF1376 family)